MAAKRASAAPSLQLRVGEQRWSYSVGPVVIGRGHNAAVRVDDLRVSRRHVVLESSLTGWRLVDVSRNGIFLDRRPITQLTIDSQVTIRLGDPTAGAEVTLTPYGQPTKRAESATQYAKLTGVRRLGPGVVRIGRSLDNDVVLDDLLVSRHHAELTRTERLWRITDLASPNGTFVNGRRVHDAIVTPADVIGIGHALLQFDHDQVTLRADTGEVEFEARNLAVATRDGKALLDGVSLTLPSHSLLAVVGPSGAGKSTLLGALTGFRPAHSGAVYYGGRDLYHDYDELRQRIGLVPQEDILHTQLTVRKALSFAARLRFPADVPAHERDHRIDEVIAELGLAPHAEQRIDSLSGGQRKRTSVALELLTRPSLLFLDEPTSGLDPGLDKSLMHTLRELADGGRSVVVVTHNVANLDVCDRLLMLAPGGRTAFFGPPNEALDYFQKPDFAEIFIALDQEKHVDWAARFRLSPLYHRYLADNVAHQSRSTAPPGPAPRQQPPLTQLAVLCRRALALLAADRPYATFCAILPLVLSALARAVPGTSGLSASAASRQDPQPQQLLLILIIGAALMGMAAAFRELVKERPIYQRERAVGLSAGSYLASKILVLGAVTTLQATAFVTLSLAGRTPPDDPLVLSVGQLEVFLAVLAVGLTSMLIGLAISAFIDNADRGMPALVLMIMTQLVLSGGLFAVHGRPGLEQLSWLVPSRWAFAMAAATCQLDKPDQGSPDPLWEHTASTWGAEGLILVGMMITLTVTIAYSLTRLDPGRR